MCYSVEVFGRRCTFCKSHYSILRNDLNLNSISTIFFFFFKKLKFNILPKIKTKCKNKIQQVRQSCLLLPARSSRNLTNRSFGLIRLRRARRMFTKVRSTHRNVIYRRCPCGTATSMGDSLERRKRSLSMYLHFSLFFLYLFN